MRQVIFLIQNIIQFACKNTRYCALLGLGIVTVAGCTLESTPVPTPNIPRVQFIAPPNNSRVVNGTDLTIDLFAQDNHLGIAKIEFYADGSLIKEASLPNYDVQTDFRVQVNWLASGIGFHALSAIAYRPDGTRSDEAFLSIEVVDK